MSDTAAADNARLVRCPNCKNLLPQLPGYSVFNCGGCSALLAADKEMVGDANRKSNTLFDKHKEIFIGASEMDVKLKLNGSSPIGEIKDVAGDQGIVRSKKSPSFNEVGKGRQFEINCGTEIDGNGMSFFEDKEKMLECRNDGVMLSSSNCLEEGPSNYMYNSDRASHVDARMRSEYLEGSMSVEHLEQDRLELLRKLEELNNQLRRSGSLSGTTKKKGILGRDMAHNETHGIADTWMANDYLDISKASKQTCLDDKIFGRPPYYVNYPDSYLSTNRHGPYMQSSYHHPHIQDDTLRYGMSFESQMPRRPATSMASQYAYHPNFPLYHPGQYIDADPDTFKPYQHNAIFHHHTCSCFHCYNLHQSTTPSVPRSNFPDGTYADMSSNPMVYHHNYDPRVTRGLTSFHDTGTHTRGAGDFKSRVGINENLCARRIVLSKGGGRQCYPLVGGAPFMACHNCFELLQLPIKLLKSVDHQNKLRCGACASLIYYFFQGNKLLISEYSELKNESESSEVMDRGISKSVGPVNRTDGKFNSNDFDSSGTDFKLFDEEQALRDTYCNMNTNKTHDANSISTSSASPSSTEDESSQLYLKTQRNLQSSTAPPPGSPLQEHFDYSSSNHIINQDGKGNLNRRSDHEKVIPKAVVTADQNLSKEVSMATEMEISLNAYSNSGISQDSGDGSKEAQQQQINRKDGFASIIKKSFKEIIKLDQGNEGDKTFVTINGRPIPDRIIKKAARRAGRVQPGDYWYDVRAGFWGVMGGPCLGIILPFIEEFNYPLSEDCSGGTTGVFVNGRELHEKDLELLSGRGLPTTRDRSYIIEISGRVLDADSGKELDSLGRLARTVEKAKHGFGMKVPKQIVVNKIEQ